MASFPFIKDDLEIITIISNQACLKQKILLASIRSDPTCVWQSTHILCFMVHRKGFTKHLMTVNFLKLAKELTHPFFFFERGCIHHEIFSVCILGEFLSPQKRWLSIQKTFGESLGEFYFSASTWTAPAFFHSNWIIYISHCNQLAYCSSTWEFCPCPMVTIKEMFSYVVPSSYKKNLHFPHLLWVGPRDSYTSSIEASFHHLQRELGSLEDPKNHLKN